MASNINNTWRLLTLNGLIAINKPPGITCSNLLNNIKRNLFRETGELYNFGKRSKFKIGHGGTLDKNAEGVLVLGIGSATKQLTEVLKGSKKYEATGCLGSATDTFDSSGKVVSCDPHDHVFRDDLENALEKFRGNIFQVPPIYSALKLKGERMSDLAARGQQIEPKPARPVTVHCLQCTEFDAPHFSLSIHCGGGFYVRSLIHDLGKSLGTSAHMTHLLRTEQGPFNLTQHALQPETLTVKIIEEAILHKCPPGIS